MSKYTTEVRYICETSAGLENSEGYTSVNKIIADSMDKIFDFDYPIFDPAYKPVLQRKILKHYYTREIGMETVGLWKHFLDMKMNEIMPYYNKLYLSETLSFNPLYDIDLTTTHRTDGTKNSTGEKLNVGLDTNEKELNLTEGFAGETEKHTTGEDSNEKTTDTSGQDSTAISKTLGGSDTTSKTTQDSGTESESGSDIKKNTRWDIYSDTPQGSLQNVQNETYLTNARKITDDGTGSTNSKTTTFGKKVTESGTTTYGRTETETDTTTYGKSVEENETTTYGKVENENSESTKTNTGTETNERNTRDTETTSDNITTTEDYLQHVYGKSSGISFSKLLAEYRETFLNIDMMVIEDLGELFMNLW